MLRLSWRAVALACASAWIALPTASAAPTVELLYLQGEVLDGAASLPGFIAPNPGGRPATRGDVVRSNGQGDLHVAPNGSFVTRVRTNPDQGSANSAAGSYYLFGSSDRGRNPVAFRRESTTLSPEQQNFGSPSIDHSGVVSYTALTGNTGTAGSGDGVLWEDDTPVIEVGDPIPSGPLAGFFFNSAVNPFRTPDGVTRWQSSYAATAGGTSVGSAVFRDTSTYDVVLQSGDVITDFGPVQPIGGAISGNLVWSALGTNYLTEISIPNGQLNNQNEPLYDGGVILNGVALRTASGGLLRDGLPTPVADGGLPGENFSSFFQWDVNEAGDYLLGAFTDAADTEDDIVLHNGVVRYREGQVLDGVTLQGQVNGLGINDRGDIAIVWSDTLFINDQAVLRPGDPIDSDGDGIDDVTWNGASLNNFDITNLPAAGGGGLPVVYLSGEVDRPFPPFGVETLDTHLRFEPADTSTGDYNGDGVVDAADYTVWRDTDGSSLLLGADGDEDNTVNAGDYTVWATGFGGSAPAAVVPEASTACLAAIGLLVRRRR